MVGGGGSGVHGRRRGSGVCGRRGKEIHGLR